MAAQDVKDKPITDSEVTSDRDKWSAEDEAGRHQANDEYEQQQKQQQQPEPPPQQADDKNKQTPRSKAFRDAAKKQLKQKAKAIIKKNAQRAARKAAEEGAKLALETGASAVIAAPTGEAAEPLVQAAIKAAEIAAMEEAKLIKKGGEVLVDPKQAGDLYKDAKKEAAKGKKWAAIAMGIFITLIILFVLLLGGDSDQLIKEQQDALLLSNSTLQITKSGPATGSVNQVLTYTINVVDTAATSDIDVFDNVPAGTIFDHVDPGVKVSCETASGNCGSTSKTITWSSATNKIPSPVNTQFNIYLKVVSDNIYIANIAHGTAYGVLAGGDIAKLLPDPLPPDPAGFAPTTIRFILDSYRSNTTFLETYKAAAAITGLPWQVLGGIHYREGMGTVIAPQSLVSGRPIGAIEPDVPLSACPPSNPAGVSDGLAELVTLTVNGVRSTGCQFSSLLDSAIYAGNHLKGKIGGIPQSFQDLVIAVSRYNGGGNRNCGRGALAPDYGGPCPPPFFGHDDDYAMNYFDDAHDPMYIIFYADHLMYSSPHIDGRPGVVTVIKLLAGDANL